MNMHSNTRREFLKSTAGSLATIAGAGGISLNRLVAAPPPELPAGKAEHCIMIWLGGGAAQMDTWDPKELGDPETNKPGSAYPSIATAIPGVRVCEHLPDCADRLDRFVVVRSCHHDIIDEHSAANNFVHTGRKTTGTLTYPSLGSLVSHQKGSLDGKAPAYVVIGYPSIMRGPGFLGPKHSFVYLTDTEKGPRALATPRIVSDERLDRRQALLDRLVEDFANKEGDDPLVEDYLIAQRQARSLSGGDFMKAFNLSAEPSSLREKYGDEFGQRCLLARRLVQRGVRFSEVSFNLNFINGTGWDTHKGGQKNQHHLIRSLDKALAALVDDLESHRLLDKTLVVVATEFGRPFRFDGAGGRGHWSRAFSMVFAGGGLQSGQVIGVTDDRAEKILQDPVSIPDFHATIHHALGINPHRSIYSGDRPVPVTDNGSPIASLFS